jgi:hypothetical protein
VVGEDSRYLRAGDELADMTETHGTNASGDEQSSQTPQTRAVAIALQLRPERLIEFVECHPNPTVDAVLALADRPPANQDTREMVAEWVDARDSPSATVKHEDRAGGDTDGLAGLTRGVEQ